MTMTFETAMEKFLALATAREITYIRATYPTLEPGTFEVSPGGKRFVRVIKKSHGSRSAYCFVERETGNIYKPAGWKTPTTNIVRGNIFAEDVLAGTGIHGTSYAWELK